MEKAINKDSSPDEAFVKANEALLHFRQANTAWESGANKKALKDFLNAAHLGLGSAQHNVGYFYDVGIGTRKDLMKALQWYKKAWRTDRQTDTCINIAKVYEAQGNVRNARFWWGKSVDAGDGDAALELAKVHAKEDGANAVHLAIALLRRVQKSKNVTEQAVEEAAYLLEKLLARRRSGAE